MIEGRRIKVGGGGEQRQESIGELMQANANRWRPTAQKYKGVTSDPIKCPIRLANEALPLGPTHTLSGSRLIFH